MLQAMKQDYLTLPVPWVILKKMAEWNYFLIIILLSYFPLICTEYGNFPHKQLKVCLKYIELL